MRARTALAAILATVAYGAMGGSPAQAQVPDGRGYGMALWEGQERPVNAAPADTTITHVGVGLYRVVFPGEAARHGVAHVTAISADPVWCQVLALGTAGTAEVVAVGCYRAGGVPADTSFTVSFSGSDSATPPPAPELGKFGYLDVHADGTLVTAYNSYGRTNTVTPVSVGVYRVVLPGLGAAGGRRGGLQVTAVNPGMPVRCKVVTWTTTVAAQDVLVACHNAAGLRTGTRFVLTVHDRPLWGEQFPWTQYGYMWRQGSTGSEATNFNSLLGAGGNRALDGPNGQVAVELPLLTDRPNTVQLAGFGADASFCALVTKWVVAGIVTFVPGVRCYTSTGAPTSPAFLLWYGNNPA
jgi:hypothetical protein